MLEKKILSIVKFGESYAEHRRKMYKINDENLAPIGTVSMCIQLLLLVLLLFQFLSLINFDFDFLFVFLEGEGNIRS